MSCPTLLPDPKRLHLEFAAPTAHDITLVISATQPRAPCPLCGQASARIHSTYQRRVTDLPIAGIPVRWVLQARKFFCDNPNCERRVFTERLPGVVQSYARKTDRLQAVLHVLGYTLGGEAGARVAAALRLVVSADALLRLVRTKAAAGGSTPRVLGVDDFALRRGHRYGTVLVDLEKHALVDLLPDREAQTLEKWLRAHPGVEVISRDRAGAYAEGATRGAPDATQIADRWHLLRNVADALEQVLGRERRALKEAARLTTPEPVPAARSPSQNERLKAESRARRLARFEHVRALLALDPEGTDPAGLTRAEMAQAAGVSRTTLYRWLPNEAFPERKPLPRRARLVDPFVPYLLRRWDAGCQDVTRLWREIVAQGFTGTQGMVGYALRDQCAALKARRARERLPVPSPRQALWLLLTPEEKREPEDQRFAAELGRLSPAVQTAQDLALAFFALVRGRDAGGLEPWLSGALQSAVPEMASCARGMRKDEAAVAAGLSSPWSNGQVEGQVNRLKLVKRQMYGRAKFDLLRARVLPLVRA